MRARILALAGLAVVAGCSHGGGAAIQESQLPTLVLQAADLPRGFTEFDSGKQVRIDAHAGPREDPERFGRIEGWKARYRWIGARSARGLLVVESRADLFDAAGGAAKDLDAYRGELEQAPAGSGARVTKLNPQALGDEAIAFRSTQGSLVFVTVAWRRANATASILAEGFAGRFELRDVFTLARRQARRLDRAAE